MNKLETLALLTTLISFCASVLYQVWRMSSSVSDMRHNLEKQDIRLENLNDVQSLAFNGFREKIEHSVTRLRSELSELDQRLESTEGFLTKNTAFQKRS